MHAVYWSLICCFFMYEVYAQSRHGCGRPRINPISVAQRVIGGKMARPHSWPWMVEVGAIINATLTRVCGGSIIGHHLILTAAHCIRNASRVYVIVGAHNMSAREKMVIGYFSSGYTIHERYKEGNVAYRNDIGLVHIEDKIPFNRYIQPICLPKNDVEVGTVMYTTGWGYTGYGPNDTGIETDVLMQVAIPVISNEQCQQFPEDYANISYTEICAGMSDPSAGACTGDSGGPLVTQGRQGKWTIHGVTASGPTIYDPVSGEKLSVSCDGPKGVGIFARVSKYVDWIHKHSGVTVDTE